MTTAQPFKSLGLHRNLRSILASHTRIHFIFMAVHPLLRIPARTLPKPYNTSIVCVTDASSFLGFHLVKTLLDRGYAVRAAVAYLESARDLAFLASRNPSLEVIQADVLDYEALMDAFRGCHMVFYTGGLIDPQSVAGYNEHMANLEWKGARIGLEACVDTETVKKVIFTSSLAAIVWPREDARTFDDILDDKCWSDEDVCREKKLWYALGKTQAEKTAWRIAREAGLQMVAIHPAPIMRLEGVDGRSEIKSSIAALKGIAEMYCKGILATVDVKTVVETHLCAMAQASASDRNICFDKAVLTKSEATLLASELHLPVDFSTMDVHLSRWRLQ